MIGLTAQLSTQTAAQPADAAQAAARHKKLVDASQQFEAMFLQQLLKSSSPDGEEQPSSECSSGNQTYSSFGTEAVAKAVAMAGGMGIARHIVEQVERGAKTANISSKKIDTALKS